MLPRGEKMTFYEVEGPMTLHTVMRDSVGMELRERYKPEQEIRTAYWF